MRTLDVGCGEGRFYPWIDMSQGPVIGIDKDTGHIMAARQRFPKWQFVQAVGENLPFRNASFNRIVSNLAIPYMHIPTALREMYRVLEPGTTIHLSLHTSVFTLKELRQAFPSPVATLFRLFVLLNGCIFHLTGKLLFLNGRPESFQTERGMRLALRRAGFHAIEYKHKDGRFFVRAKK